MMCYITIEIRRTEQVSRLQQLLDFRFDQVNLRRYVFVLLVK